MKNLLLATLLLCAWSAAGRDLILRIDAGADPASYAFVSLGGVPVAVADRAGVVPLRLSMLRQGTPITVMLMGARDSTFLYDTEMLERDTLPLTLVQLAGNVQPGDGKELFASLTAPVRALDVNALLEGSMRFWGAGQDSVATRFSVRNEVENRDFTYFREKGWFHHPPLFAASGLDPEGPAARALHDALTEFNFAVAAVGHNRHLYKFRPVYAYLGTEPQSGLHRFRILFPMLSHKAVQMLVYADGQKRIVRLRVAVLDKGERTIERIDASCREMTLRKPKMTVLFPERLVYDASNKYVDRNLLLDEMTVVGKWK